MKHTNINDHPQNRLDCLKGKTKLTQDDIDCLIEFKNEHPNMLSLMRYTGKNFRELSLIERRQLLECLIYGHEWLPDAGCYDEYIRYKNCYIATSKLLYDTSDTLLKETAALSRLSDLGYVVYLLPYGFARNGIGCFQKAADSITFGEFLELKSVTSTGKAAGESAYKDARAQANNVYISIVNENSEEKILNNIYRAIGRIKQDNKVNGMEDNFSGTVFLNFEQTGETFLYQVASNGVITKMKDVSPECFQKIKAAVQNSRQVVADPMTLHQHGGLPNANIADKKSLVNKKDAKKVFNVYINTINVKLSRTNNKSAETLLAIAAQVLKQLSAKEKQQLDNILLKKGVSSTKTLIKTLTKAMNGIERIRRYKDDRER